MAIHRCTQCGHLAEVSADQIGSRLICPKCSAAGTAHDTVMYVGKLLERYFASRREIEVLRDMDKVTAPSASTVIQTVVQPVQPADFDAHNTQTLSTPEQHEGLKRWFSARRIKAEFDFEAVNTTGFFDEAADLLGEDLAMSGDLLSRLRWAYRKDVNFLNIKLSEMSQKDGQAYNALCQKLYSYSFFAKYNYQRNDKLIRLNLQPAPTVRRFFEGGWLEWRAFMAMLNLCQERKLAFSCARNAKVVFENEDLHELDVVFLINDTLICIECKSGEFRHDIEKMTRLLRKLGLSKRQFIVCATDMDDTQATGMTAMYELSFVTPDQLIASLQQPFAYSPGLV
jgi:DNA-directed RNA polymerase subunit M/transcription elongation factor TFIIS